jgi:RimJ/RimL family protein N-acetyltransferase
MKSPSLASINEDLSLRSIREQDYNLLLEWVNEPAVRKASFNPSIIAESEHKAWFHRVLSSTKVQIFILEKNRVPVGQIRFDESSDPNSFEIDFSIDKNMRGRGLGKELIRLGIEKHWRPGFGEVQYTAKVKPENLASQKSFLNAGFIAGETSDDAILFRRIVRD